MRDLSAIEYSNPLVLAYIGDSVYNLLVKRDLVNVKVMALGDLHEIAAKVLSCEVQAKVAESLLDVLTSKELEVYRKARNAHIKHFPKHASPADYHKATALEAVFGYLFLSEQNDRLKELYDFVKLKNKEMI